MFVPSTGGEFVSTNYQSWIYEPFSCAFVERDFGRKAGRAHVFGPSSSDFRVLFLAPVLESGGKSDSAPSQMSGSRNSSEICAGFQAAGLHSRSLQLCACNAVRKNPSLSRRNLRSSGQWNSLGDSALYKARQPTEGQRIFVLWRVSLFINCHRASKPPSKQPHLPP